MHGLQREPSSHGMPSAHHTPSLPVSWELGVCWDAIPQTAPRGGAIGLPGELIKMCLVGLAFSRPLLVIRTPASILSHFRGHLLQEDLHTLPRLRWEPPQCSYKSLCCIIIVQLSEYPWILRA